MTVGKVCCGAGVTNAGVPETRSAWSPAPAIIMSAGDGVRE